MMGELTGKGTHLDEAESTTQTARQLPIKIRPGTSQANARSRLRAGQLLLNRSFLDGEAFG